MSKKTLNQANLEKLGAKTLAALVMDLVQGSAALQRRARMELSAAQGPKEVARDLRKRFASLCRATSFVDWRKQRALVKDLEGLLGMIENTIAPHDADEAFELLWSFLQLAPSIHERMDDSNGAVGAVMSDAVELIAELSPSVSLDRTALAERVLDAVADAGYGEFDGIIPATAEALGREGLEHLKQITEAWAEAPPTEHDLEQYRGYGLRSSPEDIVRRNKQVTRSIILADVADAQGDVDAYMARYPEQDFHSLSGQCCTLPCRAAVKQVWIAASLNCCCRPRLPLGGGTRIIPGSNQIESDPRCFSAVLYEAQFAVLYFVGAQLFMPSSYHAGFTS